MTLATGAPVVTLRNAPVDPYDGAIAAARTCYAPRLITTRDLTDTQRENIGKLTYDGGHHTVYQHAHFEFGLEQVSRQFVWSFLHSHPFYNSEQQSQRYVKMGEPRAHVPPSLAGEARGVFERAVLDAWASYERLSALLKDDTFRILKELRYVTPNVSAERLRGIEREAEKKSIETARYVIPLAAFTAMVHTISGITLYRLWRMAESGDAPGETRTIVAAMVDAVRAHDPQLFDRIAVEPIARESLPEAAVAVGRHSTAFAQQFDARLGGRVSKLIDASPEAEWVTAEAVRAVFGLDAAEMPDDEAIARALDPSQNRLRLDTLNLSYHSPLMRALQHAHYVFAKRISHTADSQDQRHRMVPASRPLMTMADAPEPDVVMPQLIAANPAARAEFEAQVARAWAARDRLLSLGVPRELALYVLPNATAVRFIESGPLIALVHKWTMRTCFNAQEEIYRASMDEVEQVQARHPRLGRHLGPPCVIRNGLISPRCTEGTHFCGVPVWRDWPNAVRRL